MTTLEWNTLTDARATLAHAYDAAAQMKDANIEARPDRIIVTSNRKLKKVREFTVVAVGRHVTVNVPNVNETQARYFLRDFLKALDTIIDDQGWNAATRKMSKLELLTVPRDRALKILEPEEQIRAIGWGKYEKRDCLTLVTDSLVKLHTMNLAGKKEEVHIFPISDITFVAAFPARISDHLEFTAHGHTHKITGMTQGHGKSLASAITDRKGHSVPPPPGVGAPGASTDPAATLIRLSELHATGALTDAEFAAAKAKILGI